VVLLHIWQPVWKPRLTWMQPVVRYFLDFGSKNFTSVLLSQVLDQFDDVWAGLFLGKTALGFYSRAYAFATYPRVMLADPIRLVAGGTYAELKHDRRRLSEAFRRTNLFMVRSGFLLAGLITLIAPEFIRIVLGEKWLPMLDAFRLMLVFTLFDPMLNTVANLFISVGQPMLVVRIRGVQLGVMLIGLFVLGPVFGIMGVALAVDLMLVLGIALLLGKAHAYVDYSLREMFAAPMFALIVGLPLALGASMLPGLPASDWYTGAAKLAVFSVVYSGILVLSEYDRLSETLTILKRHLSQ
jgi:O-antigen/teichoic acid export membrane protein